MFKYLCVVLIIFQISIFAEETTNKVPEYNFIYEKEFSFNLEETNNINEISIMIERRGLPLVNRLVRFISTDPEIFNFETEIINTNNGFEETEIVSTNIFVAPTDENGIASANINLNKIGKAVVIMHILYVGSTGNTNISYEEFANINIKNTPSIPSIIFNNQDDNLNVNTSIFLELTLYPALFLISIALIFISYFRHIYYEYRASKSKIIMYSFFGFSTVQKKFLYLMIVIFIELILIGISLIISSYVLPITFLSFFIAGFIVKNKKLYSIGFFILASISMIDLYLKVFLNYFAIESIIQASLMTNPFLVFFIFLLLTALSGGIYIPSSILILYKTVFNLGNTGLIIALVGIFISSLLYILKVKKDIPFLYELDLLKIRDNY
ncbi:hypothetical protein [Brachyspira pilosicoli]|uniref:hypothetical protein n=1 Tax=Brachyspira pilosicoli TaxID=52584 RepID=UPI003004078F